MEFKVAFILIVACLAQGFPGKQGFSDSLKQVAQYVDDIPEEFEEAIDEIDELRDDVSVSVMEAYAKGVDPQVILACFRQQKGAYVALGQRVAAMMRKAAQEMAQELGETSEKYAKRAEVPLRNIAIVMKTLPGKMWELIKDKQFDKAYELVKESRRIVRENAIELVKIMKELRAEVPELADKAEKMAQEIREEARKGRLAIYEAFTKCVENGGPDKVVTEFEEAFEEMDELRESVTASIMEAEMKGTNADLVVACFRQQKDAYIALGRRTADKARKAYQELVKEFGEKYAKYAKRMEAPLKNMAELFESLHVKMWELIQSKQFDKAAQLFVESRMIMVQNGIELAKINKELRAEAPQLANKVDKMGREAREEYEKGRKEIFEAFVECVKNGGPKGVEAEFEEAVEEMDHLREAVTASMMEAQMKGADPEVIVACFRQQKGAYNALSQRMAAKTRKVYQELVQEFGEKYEKYAKRMEAPLRSMAIVVKSLPGKMWELIKNQEFDKAVELMKESRRIMMQNGMELGKINKELRAEAPELADKVDKMGREVREEYGKGCKAIYEAFAQCVKNGGPKEVAEEFEEALEEMDQLRESVTASMMEAQMKGADPEVIVACFRQQKGAYVAFSQRIASKTRKAFQELVQEFGEKYQKYAQRMEVPLRNMIIVLKSVPGKMWELIKNQEFEKAAELIRESRRIMMQNGMELGKINKELRAEAPELADKVEKMGREVREEFRAGCKAIYEAYAQCVKNGGPNKVAEEFEGALEEMDQLRESVTVSMMEAQMKGADPEVIVACFRQQKGAYNALSQRMAAKTRKVYQELVQEFGEKYQKYAQRMEAPLRNMAIVLKTVPGKMWELIKNQEFDKAAELMREFRRIMMQNGMELGKINKELRAEAPELADKVEKMGREVREEFRAGCKAIYEAYAQCVKNGGPNKVAEEFEEALEEMDQLRESVTAYMMEAQMKGADPEVIVACFRQQKGAYNALSQRMAAKTRKVYQELVQEFGEKYQKYAQRMEVPLRNMIIVLKSVPGKMWELIKNQEFEKAAELMKESRRIMMQNGMELGKINKELRAEAPEMADKVEKMGREVREEFRAGCKVIYEAFAQCVKNGGPDKVVEEFEETLDEMDQLRESVTDSFMEAQETGTNPEVIIACFREQRDAYVALGQRIGGMVRKAAEEMAEELGEKYEKYAKRAEVPLRNIATVIKSFPEKMWELIKNKEFDKAFELVRESRRTVRENAMELAKIMKELRAEVPELAEKAEKMAQEIREESRRGRIAIYEAFFKCVENGGPQKA